MTTSGLLQDRAYADIKALIQDGSFAAGSFLSERQLAARLHMSKTPVKNALVRLELEGFVSVSPQQGIVVRESSVQEIVDILDLRLALEPYVVRRIAGKFGINLDNAITTITVRKFCEASDGNIHTDHWSKLITVLVYFNTDWADGGGQLRLLRSATDIENYAAEVAPIGGTLLVFRRSDHSWHGHKQFVGERRMLQMNFVKPSRMARYTQQIDRLSTRVMKRIARIVP